MFNFFRKKKKETPKPQGFSRSSSDTPITDVGYESGSIHSADTGGIFQGFGGGDFGGGGAGGSFDSGSSDSGGGDCGGGDGGGGGGD